MYNIFQTPVINPAIFFSFLFKVTQNLAHIQYIKCRISVKYRIFYDD